MRRFVALALTGAIALEWFRSQPPMRACRRRGEDQAEEAVEEGQPEHQVEEHDHDLRRARADAAAERQPDDPRPPEAVQGELQEVGQVLQDRTPAGLGLAATTDDAIEGVWQEVRRLRGQGQHGRGSRSPASGLIIDVEVTAFNESNKELLLFRKPVGSFSSLPASILVGKLRRRSKVAAGHGTPYKKSLDVTIPPLAAGAISFFEVTIPKGTYVQARCKPKKLQWQATTFFSDGTRRRRIPSDEVQAKAKVATSQQAAQLSPSQSAIR